MILLYVSIAVVLSISLFLIFRKKRILRELELNFIAKPTDRKVAELNWFFERKKFVSIEIIASTRGGSKVTIYDYNLTVNDRKSTIAGTPVKNGNLIKYRNYKTEDSIILEVTVNDFTHKVMQIPVDYNDKKLSNQKITYLI